MPDQVSSSPIRRVRSGFRVLVLARSVLPLHGYGGLERHVGDLVSYLLRSGSGVTLITRPPSPHRAQGGDALNDERAFLSQPHLDVRFVPYRTFPLAGRRGTTVVDRSLAYPWFGRRAGRLAAALIAEGHAQIVHGLGASALGYAAARRRDPQGTVPLVFNPQGLEEFGAAGMIDVTAKLKRLAYRPLRRAVRACATAADRIIATDRVLEPAVLQHLRVPADRVRIVPNAIDLDACRSLASPEDGERLRRRIGCDPDVPLLVSAGRVERNKGFHVLLESLAGMTDRPWLWALVGDGPFRPRLERLIAERRLGSRVLLPGRVVDRELHGWYEAASIFVHPTLYEGSSLVTLEAMSHGRAVVATRAGGLPDKVEHGVNGWLVAPGQPVELRRALEDALSDVSRLKRMGMESRRIVSEQFSWQTVINRLLEVYAELLPDRVLAP